MSLDNPTRIDKAIVWLKTPGKLKLVGVLAGIVVVIALVLFAFDRCGDWRFNRGMSKANANLVKELDKLSNVQDQQAEAEKTLQRLAIEEAAQKQIIIETAKDAEVAEKAERDAQIAANQAVANVEAVNARDFTNSTLEDAEKARCKAFPDSCQ